MVNMMCFGDDGCDFFDSKDMWGKLMFCVIEGVGGWESGFVVFCCEKGGEWF